MSIYIIGYRTIFHLLSDKNRISPVKESGEYPIFLRDIYGQLLNVVLIKRVAAVRAEFRQIGGICRFPSALVTAVARLHSRLWRTAVGAEFACIDSTAGTGPACICYRSLRLLSAALRAEVAGNNSTAGALPLITGRLGRWSTLRSRLLCLGCLLLSML